MKHYKIKWNENLNETELKILLEHWEGFFEMKLAFQFDRFQTSNETELKILLENWEGFFEVKEVKK